MPSFEEVMRHIREYHPSVTHCFITIEGIWQFTDDHFNAPEFNHGVNVSMLEDFLDSLSELPFCGYYSGE